MVWRIKFFPVKGERLSPFDFIIELPKSESVSIKNRLQVIRERPILEWPRDWVKKIEGKVYQLKAGDFRLMYCIDDKEIVILHAFRKVSQKTKPRDINIALANYDKYIRTKGM